ncbi:hypothetical protein PIB30_013955 [Stylosanthes scabra]|uniref:Disease resistance protein RGA3 n=1 Tax=Stylosanthes scabra TaxID=79078 RepID=A0ABU6X3Y6_9FABA|nr:hypothetical protein [Stylosanthes scabra]
MFFLVSGLLTDILTKVDSATYKEISLLWGLKDEIDTLKNSLRFINAFILDAENKQTESKSIMEWLQQLRDCFFDARDILDEIECEALRNKVVKSQGSFKRKVKHFFSLSNPLAFRIQVAHKIKKIKKRIDELGTLRMQFGLSEIHASSSSSNVHVPKLAWRETKSSVRPSDVIGRDEEKDKIIGLLMVPPSDSGNEIIDVIPIVGIGGLGKTTIAQLVYNDDRVVENFKLRMWVFVSDDFDVKRLALEILKAMNGTDIDAHHNYSYDQLQNLLREGLDSTKFLLVLDDVWNEDYRAWSELRNLLVGMHDDGNNGIGSKIIVTTRSEKVASIMGKAYKLLYLPDEDCLKLFLRCAFPAGEGKQYPRLVEIGKEIARKCKGLPLAVVSLGCMLRSELRESVWKKTRDSEIWKTDQQKDGILAPLRLSYNHLPSELKRCFSYCSVFPKGHEYSNLELISFWMAHGLLQTNNEDEEAEDLGEFYIQELVSKSFFEGVPEDQVVVDGLIFEELKHLGISYFKMHDLINDLAVSTMQNERAAVRFNSTNVRENVHHLSFSESREGVPNFGNKMLSKVQTIGFWHASESASAITGPFLRWVSKEFRYLRVLNLQGSNFQFLPDCFYKMKHLRYLNLSYCQRMEKLPDSICKLQNLEVLNLCRCVALKYIPKNLMNLVSLRILWITTQVNDLSYIGFKTFSSLQILILWNCENLAFLPHDLGHLTALKRLSIEACLEVTHFGDEGEQEIEEDYSLKLEQFSINQLPELLALPNWLRRCSKTLRYLGLSQCQSLTAFPEWLPVLTSLETLLIADCPKLTLPHNIDSVHNLQNLKIFGCPQLVEKCKRDTGPDWCKISHIPNVELESV